MSFDDGDMFADLAAPASPAPAPASTYTPPMAPAPASPVVPHHDSPAKSSSSSVNSLADQKSPFQQQWEADQAKRLDEQKKREESKRKENIAQAQKQIAQFYAERNEKKKVALQNLKATETTGPKSTASWSGVSNLVDLSDKGRKSEKDTSKFKSILIEMKQQK